MAKRPAGLRAILHAFDGGELDVDVLGTFDRPVYFALDGHSNPDYYGQMANRLAAIFPDFAIETFPERPKSALRSIARLNALIAVERRSERLSW